MRCLRSQSAESENQESMLVFSRGSDAIDTTSQRGRPGSNTKTRCETDELNAVSVEAKSDRLALLEEINVEGMEWAVGLPPSMSLFVLFSHGPHESKHREGINVERGLLLHWTFSRRTDANTNREKLVSWRRPSVLWTVGPNHDTQIIDTVVDLHLAGNEDMCSLPIF